MDENKDKPARGGWRGVPKKSLNDGGGPSRPLVVRLSDAQHAKYERNGKAAWLRGLIDAAPDVDDVDDADGLVQRR